MRRRRRRHPVQHHRALAHDALHTGLAREKLEELGAFTAIFKQENEA